MVQIKGLAVRARLDYLQSVFGDEGLNIVVKALAPEHAQLLSGGVLVSAWYPLSLSDDILGTAERLLGKCDGSLCHEIGRASGRGGLTTVHSAFASSTDPLQIASKMARSTALLWRAYYDVGAMHTRPVGELGIESWLEDIELKEPWICHVLSGYIASHIEVLGGADVSVVHCECRTRGGEQCRWRASWTAP